MITQEAVNAVPRTSEKRERLLQAGRQLIYSKGFARTTLSDIADAAGVPLGNIYYYFRTKEDLLDAVVNAQEDDFRARAAKFDEQPTPKTRLLALLDSVIASRDRLAQYGCPVGSLAQELNKQYRAPGPRVNQGLVMRAEWASRQFRDLGRNDAEELGVWLTASIQGAILMANALADPDVIRRQMRQLKAWIEAF